VVTHGGTIAMQTAVLNDWLAFHHMRQEAGAASSWCICNFKDTQLQTKTNRAWTGLFVVNMHSDASLLASIDGCGGIGLGRLPDCSFRTTSGLHQPSLFPSPHRAVASMNHEASPYGRAEDDVPGSPKRKKVRAKYAPKAW